MGLGALAAAAAAARRIIPVTFTTRLSKSDLSNHSIGKFPFVKFFCVFTGKHHTSYQKMIRQLLDGYSSYHQKSA